MPAPSESRNSNAGRPALAIVSNEQTPYRLHYHRRIVAEIPELELFSVFTHEVASSPWAYEAAPEIQPVLFGRGESTSDQSRVAGALREWAKGRRILDWMAGRRVAAVVVNGYNDVGRLRILRRCAQLGVPTLLFGDSNVAGEPAAGLKRRVKSIVLPRILRLCTAVLCCGRLGRAYFERYGAAPEQIFETPYEPNYDSIRDVPPTAVDRIRCQFGLDPTRRRLLFSGRLAPVKRVDLLLRAFAHIAKERPTWDLLVAGEGPLRGQLARLVPPSLAGRVIWAGFVADRETIAAIYASSDVLVLPSDYEPWGVVVTEAAVHNAIVASSVTGAAEEVVRDGVNGRLFQVGSLDALTSALLDVTDPARIDRMKAESASVLAEWRARADPVSGLREALRYARALPGE